MITSTPPALPWLCDHFPGPHGCAGGGWQHGCTLCGKQESRTMTHAPTPPLALAPVPIPPIDRDRKNELRTWAGLPELPPTVAEAVVAAAHPDAAVYRIGAEIANRVLLVGADLPTVDLHINGAASLNAPVTAITPATGAQPSPTLHLPIARRQRPKYLRPCLSPDPRKRLAQLLELLAQTQQEIEPAT